MRTRLPMRVYRTTQSLLAYCMGATLLDPLVRAFSVNIFGALSLNLPDVLTNAAVCSWDDGYGQESAPEPSAIIGDRPAATRSATLIGGFHSAEKSYFLTCFAGLALNMAEDRRRRVPHVLPGDERDRLLKIPRLSRSRHNRTRNHAGSSIGGILGRVVTSFGASAVSQALPGLFTLFTFLGFPLSAHFSRRSFTSRPFAEHRPFLRTFLYVRASGSGRAGRKFIHDSFTPVPARIILPRLRAHFISGNNQRREGKPC